MSISSSNEVSFLTFEIPKLNEHTAEGSSAEETAGTGVPVGKSEEEIKAAAEKAAREAAAKRAMESWGSAPIQNPILLWGKGETNKTGSATGVLFTPRSESSEPDLSTLMTDISIPPELQQDAGFMAGMRKAYADAMAKFSKPQSPQAQTTEFPRAAAPEQSQAASATPSNSDAQVNSKEAGTPVQSSAQSVQNSQRYKVLHQKLDDHSITLKELGELEKINLGEFEDAIKADEKASLTALDRANEGAFNASLELMGVTKEQLKDVKPFTPKEYAACEAKCKNGEQLTPEENLRFAATIQKLKTRNLPSNADIEAARKFVASHPEGIDSEDFQGSNLSPEAQSYISSTAGKIKTNSSIILLR